MAQCAHGVSWDEPCPHDAVEGKELCIFHLPVEQKDPAGFWKHLANYLLALHEKAGNDETAKFAPKQEAWFFAEQDDNLLAHYRSKVEPYQRWDFVGFVFPDMDAKHNFRGFVFGPASFYGAQFSGGADFWRAQFSGGADFRQAQFSGEAHFWNAQFSGKAEFEFAGFSGDASFVLAQFSEDAVFFAAQFSRKVGFWLTRFSGEADFRARFNGDASFMQAQFGEDTVFLGARFSGVANFGAALFEKEADFSFAEFSKPPLFDSARFEGKADFYEAKVPGLAGSDVERTARYIRLFVEKHGSYADAGDIYIIEMNARRRRFRKTPRRWFQYVLMEPYRLFSRYGESPGRSLVSLVVGLVLFSFAFTFSGYEIKGEPVKRSFGFDWSQLGPTVKDIIQGVGLGLANLLPGDRGAGPLGAELPAGWALAQAIATYIILTLFLLAIRRRFRR